MKGKRMDARNELRIQQLGIEFQRIQQIVRFPHRKESGDSDVHLGNCRAYTLKAGKSSIKIQLIDNHLINFTTSIHIFQIFEFKENINKAYDFLACSVSEIQGFSLDLRKLFRNRKGAAKKCNQRISNAAKRPHLRVHSKFNLMVLQMICVGMIVFASLPNF